MLCWLRRRTEMDRLGRLRGAGGGEVGKEEEVGEGVEAWN